MYILVAIYFRNKQVIVNPYEPSPLGFINQQNLFFITLAISVFSGSFGIAKFLKLGPLQIVPSQKLHFGFILVFLSIAATLCAKASVLAFVINNNSSPDKFPQLCLIWIGTCVLPQLILVSTMPYKVVANGTHVCKLLFNKNFIYFRLL